MDLDFFKLLKAVIVDVWSRAPCEQVIIGTISQH